MLKKVLFVLTLAMPLFFTACNKSQKCQYTTTTAVAPAAEVTNLKAWLDANSLPYTQHPSGFFYKVNSPGAGSTASVCSDVTVKYSGRVNTSSAPFDQNTAGISFPLGQLIPGWQIGIPLIQKGGSIILYIPPTLGYGSTGSGAAIPPNSNLVFNIELLNVQ